MLFYQISNVLWCNASKFCMVFEKFCVIVPYHGDKSMALYVGGHGHGPVCTLYVGGSM